MASKLSLFLAELKRRKVNRVAIVYVIVGVGILGAAEVILDPLGLEALRSYLVILVLLGLHMLIMHLDDTVGFMTPREAAAGERAPEQTDGKVEATQWQSIMHRARSPVFMVTYIALLGAALYHGLYGTRILLFELNLRPAMQQFVTIGLWALGLALFALGTRAVSLAVMAMGISLIRHRAEGDDFSRLEGWGRHLPWATAALVVGGLSLAGLPPGPGFTVRWSITRLVAREQVGGAILLVLASVAVGIGVVRALAALLQQPTPDYVGSEIVEEIEAAARTEEKAEEKPREREPRLAAAIIVASLVFCLFLALWPQFHTDVIHQVVEGYTFLDFLSP